MYTLNTILVCMSTSTSLLLKIHDLREHVDSKENKKEK